MEQERDEESFIGITAHFFANHKRCKATLAVRHFESPHTGEKVLQLVKTVLQEWEINSSQVGKVITDNGSNMTKAFRDTIDYDNDNTADDNNEDITNYEAADHGLDVEDVDEDVDAVDEMDEIELTEDEYDVEKEEREFNHNEQDHNNAFELAEFQRLSCFSHTLQLIVAKFDAIRPCKEAVATSKKIVMRFNKSVKATGMLVELSGRKLTGDCPTRWSATYLLLKRLIDLRPNVETVLAKLQWDGLQVRHWKSIESLVMLLGPFADYTSLAGGEEYTTISCVVPSILMELKLHLQKVTKQFQSSY